MGQPDSGEPLLSPDEFIVRKRPTRGTEISKYLVENKSNEILLVVTSERRTAQTVVACYRGVVGPL